MRTSLRTHSAFYSCNYVEECLLKSINILLVVNMLVNYCLRSNFKFELGILMYVPALTDSLENPKVVRKNLHTCFNGFLRKLKVVVKGPLHLGYTAMSTSFPTRSVS